MKKILIPLAALIMSVTFVLAGTPAPVARGASSAPACRDRAGSTGIPAGAGTAAGTAVTTARMATARAATNPTDHARQILTGRDAC